MPIGSEVCGLWLSESMGGLCAHFIISLIQVDYAFALRYQYWPEIAEEWLTRRRFGLDHVTVSQIASRGCYLVHKSCGTSVAALAVGQYAVIVD